MDKYTATEEAYKNGRRDALQEAYQGLEKIMKCTAAIGLNVAGLCEAMEHIKWMLKEEKSETK